MGNFFFVVFVVIYVIGQIYDKGLCRVNSFIFKMTWAIKRGMGIDRDIFWKEMPILEDKNNIVRFLKVEIFTLTKIKIDLL